MKLCAKDSTQQLHIFPVYYFDSTQPNLVTVTQPNLTTSTQKQLSIRPLFPPILRHKSIFIQG